ncbi:hypothetical protein ACQP25_44525 (plasmid) [Microtetraspora malaysiensis]|uniref:hypothetical protein n=1 Tax=Microtetraspora malaysiensis TaxID=161358 RepID=UPI003D8EF592
MSWIDTLADADTFERGTIARSIDGMTPRDARNLIVGLDRQAAGIMLAVTEQIVTGDYPRHPWLPKSDLAMRLMIDDPRAWLATTPLVGALAERAAAEIGPAAPVSLTLA